MKVGALLRKPGTQETSPRGTGSCVETILVVEDNEMVRNLTISVLKKQGYTVRDAANAEASPAC